MPVMNKKGELFDERRKKDRRQVDKPISSDKRVSERRKNNINAKKSKV